MKALTPLRYCQLVNVTSYEGDIAVTDCFRFASELMHGLPVCEGCAAKLKGLLEEYNVEMVDAPVVTAMLPGLDKKERKRSGS